jgi:protein-L-isoaspartate(D-aspartate) O-methyltransferase
VLAWLGMNGADAQDLAAQRARMVAEIDQMYAETRAETGLAAMAPRVRAAIGKVERHRLVPQEQANLAYRNHPLPIGHSQTISQPYIVALSTDLLAPEPGHVVLEVGTGSGYQAAVLAEIVKQVYTIEIVEPLGRAANRASPRSATRTSRSASATATRAGRRKGRSTGSSSPPRRRACRRRSSTS